MAKTSGKKQDVTPKPAFRRPRYRTVLNQGRVFVLKGRLRRGRF